MASQSRSDRCPITVNSDRRAVSTYARKQDCARSPANPQSSTMWSVTPGGLGNFVVRIPTTASGRSEKVGSARNHHGRPELCFVGSNQNADHHIAGLQSLSSDSSVSKRRSEADLNSSRSSLDQESDQSIRWFGARSASRSMSADNSVAVSGGRRRKAFNREVSRSFSCISIACSSIRPGDRWHLLVPGALWNSHSIATGDPSNVPRESVGPFHSRYLTPLPSRLPSER